MSKVKNKQILVDSSFDFNSKKLINLANPTENNDATNKFYVDSRDASLESAINDTDVGSLESRLSLEESTRASADSSLETRISTEESVSLAGDQSLTTRLSTEESVRLVGDESLTTRVSTEESTRLATDNSLETRISTEESVSLAGDQSLTTRLSTEESVRLVGDESLTTRLSTEESTRLSGDQSLESAINNIDMSSIEDLISLEESSRVAADSSLETRISTEESTRLATDSSLETRISTEESVSLAGDQSLTTRLSTEESTRLATDNSLETRISTEESVSLAGDQSLTTRLSTEESTRLAGDQSLASEIDDIVGDIETAIISIDGRISSEESTRSGADTSLATRISTEESTRLATDNSLETRISTEESSRTSADASLETLISQEIATHRHSALYNPSLSGDPIVFVDAGDNFHINASIFQQGSTYETHAEQIYTTKDYIFLRSGATAGLNPGEFAGFEAIKYDGTNNGRLVFDSGGTARVGDVGDEQPLTTRVESETITDGYFAYWDESNNRLDFMEIDIAGDIEAAAGSGLTYSDSQLHVYVENRTIKIVDNYLISSELQEQTNTTTVIASGTTGLPTNLSLTQKPVGSITMTINGIEYLVSTSGEATTNKPFYYTTMVEPDIGTVMYFNATVAGFGLDTSDLIAARYAFINVGN